MPLDPMTARLKCLRLALRANLEGTKPEKALALAKEWSAFVVGEPVKSSSSFGKAGADDPVKK